MTRVYARVGIFIGALFSVYFLGVTTQVHGALLYLDPGAVNVFRGDTITLDLRIDTDEGQCINTVNAIINYDPSIRAVDVSRGDSILSIWLEEPVIDEIKHTISFAAGIPGGYCGRIPGDPTLTNVLLELVFRSPGFSVGSGETPTARVWVDGSSRVLLHDGFGNDAPLRMEDSVITLLKTAGAENTDAWRAEVEDDEELPSDFPVTLTSEGQAFGGQYFITFNSIDKQSGIDHYEVMEEPFEEFYTFNWGRADAPWVQTASPYVLEDQTLNSTIRVKAIDKAGNERIVVLVPDAALRSISRDRLLTWIVVGGAISLIMTLLGYALWRRKQRLIAEAPTE